MSDHDLPRQRQADAGAALTGRDKRYEYPGRDFCRDAVAAVVDLDDRVAATVLVGLLAGHAIRIARANPVLALRYE